LLIDSPVLQTRTRQYGKFTLIFAIITGAFAALLYGAYNATGTRRASPATNSPKTVSNGTSLFAPTTLLISLDGFRADFLHRDLTPTLAAFIRAGVSPKYMLPSFPSVTFPNHFTLVTGLYPESHGVVGNTFWDPESKQEFYYTDPARSMKPEWWRAEPIWELAEKEGVRSAIHMWPGSEVHIGDNEPTFVDKFNAKEDLGKKVDRILSWLDLPGPEDDGADQSSPRPQLIAAYVPNVDSDGHKFGPNSTEIRKTISEVDAMLGDLFAGIEARNLTDIVNIVIVSDHGMATTDTSRLLQVEDLIDTSLIEHTDGWPLYGLRPFNTSDEHLQSLYDDLHKKSQSPEFEGTFEVYMRDHNMPARYHFSNNPRIAPLWIVPTTGWAIVTKPEFDVKAAAKSGETYHPVGLHGYDHENPLMRAIFVARGPAFPHTPGSELEVFQNTEVYGIVCDSLGLPAVANNGSLRLPLKPVGLHSLGGPGEVPEDPLPSGAKVPVIVPVPQFSNMPSVESAGVAATSSDKVTWTTDSHGSLVTYVPEYDEDGKPSSHESTPASSEEKVTWTTDSTGSLVTYSSDSDEAANMPERPQVHGGEDENLNHKDGWWAWFEGKFGDAKDWAAGVFHKEEGGDDAAS
jgi:predicted AlkP superfamily pyrophosphatase or phosphodiesterase